MEALKTLIENTLNIPYIEEGEAVQDGSFTIVLIMSTAFDGNGGPVDIRDYMRVNFFYGTKTEALSAIHTVWPVMSANGMAVQDPDYTWQDGANLWMASMLINK